MSWQSKELERSQRIQGDEKRERFEILTQRKFSDFAGRREKMENKTQIKIVNKNIHFYILGVICKKEQKFIFN